MVNPSMERYARPCIMYESLPDSVPVMVIPQLEDRRDYEWRMKLKKAGIPILATSHIGYKVLGNICRFLNYKESEHMKLNAAPDKPLTGGDCKLFRGRIKADAVCRRPALPQTGAG